MKVEMVHNNHYDRNDELNSAITTYVYY
ncbi:hypothetical protein EFL67_02655 [Weissella confusa]|nr:hypothetical protein [Weissella confusa]MCT0022539.1 hypothetical protein [Weissella confusa]TGE47688.1 hypothetical protein C6P23_06735 [Weissella confusa]TGE58467.1 hypothetical protein C6P21_06900 [Weissella confusa]